MEFCRFCWREIDHGEICDSCMETLCEICNRRLSRGYCTVCGRLVCDEDSKMIGFARVCRECLSRNPRLSDYDYLRSIYAEYAKLSTKPVEFHRFALINDDYTLRRENTYLFIGIDDFDSPYGMCTTYAGALLTKKLVLSNADLLDYPLLVRLNPNIPMKTRGNAAVSIRILVKGDIERIKRIVLDTLRGMTHAFFPKTRPAIIFYVVDRYAIDKRLFYIYRHATRHVVPLNRAMKVLEGIKTGILEIYTTTMGRPRGVIGAAAAIGAVFDDYTFELLAYRKKQNIGKRRFIDRESVVKMDRKFFPLLYDNVDAQRILIAPAGPDPVLFGLRGDFPEKLVEAFNMLRHEEIEFWCIFRTNQGTGTHIVSISRPEMARPYETIMIEITVEDTLRRGDEVIILGNRDGFRIYGYVYRMQRKLQAGILRLEKSDTIRLILAVVERKQHEIIGNVEEFIPLHLEPILVYRNPRCPICCARLKKKSRDEMYCRKCGYRTKARKILIRIPRKNPKNRKRYVGSPKSHRHLTIPNERMYFRKLKIAGHLRPYLLNIICGTNKIDPERIQKIRIIERPTII